MGMVLIVCIICTLLFDLIMIGDVEQILYVMEADAIVYCIFRAS